ncbi:T9SS type A sorting domain-containing protein [Hymenobacter busanensis]|nr:T9SS type A sorting domain-containing protein [Hymenobacter busanensis]QHJ05854.1 T9SS type A sorting domain-containing protein [Hymenobacter busanensis]
MWAYPLASQAQGTYTWNVASGNFSASGSWSPVRTLANPNDVLVFDGYVTATPTVTLDPNVTINAGQLQFKNGVNAKLFVNGADRTISINGSTGPDLVVENNATVHVNATTRNDELTINLATGTTGLINGTIVFENTAGNGNNQISEHRITGPAGSVLFGAGGTLQMANGSDGYPFGSPATGTVAVFQSGSTFIQEDGINPFGTGATPAVEFQSGSTYYYKSSNNNISVLGRTYGNLLIEAPSGSLNNLNGSGTLTVLNNLELTAANAASCAFNSSGGVSIGGDLKKNGGNLNFNPSVPTTLTLNGSTLQIISGISPLMLGMDVTLVINNPAGVQLNVPLTVQRALTLTSGQLATTPTNILSIPFDGVITANSTSYVRGPVARTINTTATATLTFPFGSIEGYRPLTLTVTHSNSANTTYTAAIVVGAPPALPMTGSIKRVSSIRYYTISSSQPNNLQTATIRLDYGVGDGVDDPSKLRIAKSQNGSWVDLGGTGNSAPAGNILSTVNFTSGGNFVLASTDPSGAPGGNPLPVVLKSFAAVRQHGQVRVAWATASEKNSAQFEVERSLDGGKHFATVGTVEAAGTSANEHAYTWLDGGAPATFLYYRLRQVDFDGTATTSAAVAVAAAGKLDAVAYPNPAFESLHLQPGSQVLSWRLLNVRGQLLRSGSTAAPVELDMSALPAGVYALELRSGSQRTVQQIMHLR